MSVLAGILGAFIPAGNAGKAASLSATSAIVGGVNGEISLNLAQAV
jgi:hypothetical protein